MSNAPPLLPPDKAFCIEQRVKLPGLIFDYGLDVLTFEQAAVYASCAQDLQYVYPNPPCSGRGDCAYIWFADNGEWIYAIDKQQRNAFVPHAWPEWLRLLSQRLHASSKLSKGGTGWNCCLIAHGTESHWTHGEDPWHRDEFVMGEIFVGGPVKLVVSHAEHPGAFALEPAAGSFMVSSGTGWSIAATSDAPTYRLSFRLIDPLRVMQRQHMAKYKHRRAQELATEVRIVPRHVKEGAAVRGPPMVEPIQVVTVEPQAARPRPKPASVIIDDDDAQEQKTEAKPKKKRKPAAKRAPPPPPPPVVEAPREEAAAAAPSKKRKPAPPPKKK
jgi:hypothetical protein